MVKKIVLALLVAFLAVFLLSTYANDEADKARDSGSYQACVDFETNTYGRSYSEATAKCEYEQEVG